MQNEKKIIIFGAGKIGRSLVGQLFSKSGYSVIFIEPRLSVVEYINKFHSYDLIFKSVESEEQITVDKVSAIHASDIEKIIEEICHAPIIAISVGKKALDEVLSVIEEALLRKFSIKKKARTDIIIAENMRSASDVVRRKLLDYLPASYPFRELVGLVETSIGKMVPDFEVDDSNPLLLVAEPFNELLVDKEAFKNGIPKVKGLIPKTDFIPWVDHKAFIHNLGHAAIAYYGKYLHRDSNYLFEIMQDPKVYSFGKQVMQESAEILLKKYPSVFKESDLKNHINDLLKRFNNPELKDTISRVGHDVIRKIGPDDRFVGIVRIAIEFDLSCEKILEAMAYSLIYAVNMKREESKDDADLGIMISRDLSGTLESVSGFIEKNDDQIISRINNHFQKLLKAQYV